MLPTAPTPSPASGVNDLQLTPLLRQYWGLKERYPEAILFFRLGDFYEMFYEDAQVASKALDITLTTRNKNAKDAVPLCGVPHHSAHTYVARLIDQGFKVAICEQMEDPRLAKGLVKREVTRVITPATVIEAELLRPAESNLLAAAVESGGRFGLARVDFLSGEFSAAELATPAELLAELSRIEPVELLLNAEAEAALGEALARDFPKTRREAAPLETPAQLRQALLSHFQAPNLEALGLAETPLAVLAAALALDYLRRAQQSALPQIRRLTLAAGGETMFLDAATRRNLELLRNFEGGESATLYAVLNRCRTAMGSRRLKRWLTYPLHSRPAIIARQEAVAELVAQPARLGQLQPALATIADLERLSGKVALRQAHPRDLGALAQSLVALPSIREALCQLPAPRLGELQRQIGDFSALAERLAKALVEAPPSNPREGGIFRPGYDAQLDELRQIARGGREWMAGFEARERARTGITNLKVRFNRVFGYYLEVTKSNLPAVPPEYQRKQTMVGAERFITEELKECERRILGADEERQEREISLFRALLEEVARQAGPLLEAAAAVSELDVLAALADTALRYDYTRPEITDGDGIEIEDGRHPVVERLLSGERFVPNSLHLDSGEQQVLIITGPNMAGKSTVIRQVALIQLLAQCGSFVPARRARLGLVDRIFTRVGAGDRLSQGQSTFMVEMTEAAHILRQATPQSLIMLDELGRGTSTFDGLSIAWAVAEYIHDTVRAKTLFATHYHELTDLARTQPRVKNFNIAVKEWQGQVLFLRQLVPGGASRSYGIEVARLAGLPEPILARARLILANLEKGELDEWGRPRVVGPEQPLAAPQLDLFRRIESRLLAEMLAVDLDRLTPLEALNMISRWKAELQK